MNTLRYKPEGWNKEISVFKSCEIDKYINEKQTLQGIVKECDNNYNLHIALEHDKVGIIPRTEVENINIDENGIPKINLCTGKVNKFVQFKVKGIRDDDSILLSRKDVQEETINWIKNDLEIGQQLNGIVKSIKPYGAFVEIAGGVVGLVHIEDVSVARIKTPAERFSIGQDIQVIVKTVNKEKGRVILSHKETLGTWEQNIEKYKRGTKTTGIIREFEKNKNGIFVELEPNLVGMAEYDENLNYGETVEVYIKKIDIEKKKVKLAII